MSAVYKIQVDGETVVTISGLYEAVMTWFATFYVLNISYPRRSKGLLQFLQKGILNVKDKSKTVMKVSLLIKQIESNVK